MSAQTTAAFLALERQLAARTNELEQERANSAAVSAEAAAYRAAVGDIFRAMAASPADARPVFAILVERAMALSGALIAVVARFDGELVHPVARCGMSAEEEAEFDALPYARAHKPERSTAQGRAILDRRVAQIADLEQERAIYEGALQPLWTGRLRSAVAVPLMHGSACIGSFSCGFAVTGVVPERIVSLLETFADQAVIAIENARLFRETQDALERQTATAEVLKVISSSVADTEPVFEKILDSCEVLFDVRDIAIALVHEDGQVHFVAMRGEHVIEASRAYPQPLSQTGTARAILERRTVHIPDADALGDSLPPSMRAARAHAGNFSLILAPLLREDRGIGSLVLLRVPPKPFTDQEIALLTTFADQAVIAIENARMFRETQEALERQTAMSDILRVISDSPTDVQPVFDAIAHRAAALCRAPSGYSFRFDGELAHLVGVVGVSRETEDAIRQSFPIKPDRSSVTGRIVLEAAPVHVADLTAEAESNVRVRVMVSAGIRGFLGVPMLREGKVIGGLGVSRAEPGRFSDSLVTLLQTFAAQAVIAVENVRLFNETREALEQQTASAEVLRVISSSVADAQPVFEKILDSCESLFDADGAQIWLLREDDRVELVAYRGRFYATADADGVPTESTFRTNPSLFALLSQGETIHHPEVTIDYAASPGMRAYAEAFGAHSNVVAPLMDHERLIGAISLVRCPPKPFSDKEIALLSTFADQAVIAIENARLFRETQEALERQTALSDILRVISESPTDVQPVFDAINERAIALTQASMGATARFDGERLHIASLKGIDEATAASARALFPTVPSNNTLSGRAVLARAPVQIPELSRDVNYQIRVTRDTDGSALAVPLLRDQQVLGTIMVIRPERGAFPDKLVTLLQTFAAQAVIAVENVRLFNETREALEQQTASAEVLRVISSSVADAQPVFEKILDSCESLFDADGAQIWLLREDDRVELVAYRGRFYATADADGVPTESTFRTNPSLFALLSQGETIHHPEVTIDYAASPGMRAYAEAFGAHSNVVAPLMDHERLIGAISLVRCPPKPFSDKEIALLTTFTDQAVIAIENARLFRETQEAQERQTATAEVLRVISASPTDVQPVFDVIAARARTLCKAAVGYSFRFDGELAHLLGVSGGTREGEDATRNIFPLKPDRSTITGRVVLDAAPVQLADMGPEYQASAAWQALTRAGARGFLSVPMLREGKVIGGLGVARTDPGGFSETLMTLLQTFAAQAVIAIENVRLFDETREALEQQTAVSDILRVTTESPTDVQPVLDAIAGHAVRLCEAASASIFLIENDHLRHVSSGGAQLEQGANLELLPIDRTSTSGRAVLERRVVHVTDMQAEAKEFPLGCEYALRLGHRTIVVAPLLREGTPFGTLMLRRMEVRPFSEGEIKLLRTFGDQAAVALENVRLFKETQEALEHQTATAEVLKVISSSVADTQPVFDKILDSCAHLFDADQLAILLVRDEHLHLAGWRGQWFEWTREAYPYPLQDTHSAVALRERRTVHVPSVSIMENRAANTQRFYERVGDFTYALAPMLQEGRGIGTLYIGRQPPKPFMDKELALLTTFADQAVIAIENARLFHEIEDKSHQLATANQHKSDFLANMSHELRTPLNAVIGFSEVLLERMFGELNEKQDDYLKDILSSGKHLLSLISDILDLSKIEAGRMELELEEFDVADALGNTLTLIRERAQQHGIGLSLEIAEGVGALRADQRKLKQIMLNLLSNAVKFTPDGGNISVHARQTDEVLEVAVSDTGIGIAAADQDTVFQEFRQVGGSYTNKQEGTGLGLALTRRFVELHGGSMSLHSAPGQGSTFTFTIPRQL